MKPDGEKEEKLISDEKEKEKINIINTEEDKEEEPELLKDKINKIKSSEVEYDEFIFHKKNFVPFKNDPYLDSNIFSRFFMFWAYKVLKISRNTKIKKEYLGKLNKKHDSKYFYDKLNNIWEQKGYRRFPVERNARAMCLIDLIRTPTLIEERKTALNAELLKHGGCYRDRTCDLLYVKQVLSQLS